MVDTRDDIPLAATEDREIDWVDVTGWGVFKGHAIPVEVGRYIADKINAYHKHRLAALEAQLAEAKAELRTARSMISSTHKHPVKHENCKTPYCPICEGGLFVCADCGAAEIETEQKVCTSPALEATPPAPKDEGEPIRNEAGEVVAYRDYAGNVGWVGSPSKQQPAPKVTEDDVARRIFNDAHAGMRNCYDWDTPGLEDEHPGTIDRYRGYARSAIAALTAAQEEGR